MRRKKHHHGHHKSPRKVLGVVTTLQNPPLIVLKGMESVSPWMQRDVGRVKITPEKKAGRWKDSLCNSFNVIITAESPLYQRGL